MSAGTSSEHEAQKDSTNTQGVHLAVQKHEADVEGQHVTGVIEEQRPPSSRPPARRGSWRRRACILTWVLIKLLLLVYFSVSYYVGSLIARIDPKAWNVADNGEVLNPASLGPKLRPGSRFLGGCGSEDLLDEFLNFSASSPWTLVHFPSRPGSDGQDLVNLTGWWLPAMSADGAPPEDTSPRVVLIHGYAGNFNHHNVQIAGYFLRSIGFSVLIISLRNHGLSQNSSTPYSTWGWAIFLDALGAWDYAVQDPDGILGGPLPPEKVGMMGFSMGGFTAAIALGMEPRIPGAWLDSPVFDAQEVLKDNAALVIGDFVAGLIILPAMLVAKLITGVDLLLHSPGGALSRRPLSTSHSQAPQRVALWANQLDGYVPVEQHYWYVEAFEEINSKCKATRSQDCYQLDINNVLEYHCGGEDHCNIHTWAPAMYRAQLCAFWSKVFSGDSANTSRCVDIQPSFRDCADTTVICF
eukprot:TRINITY_DN74393_c0_g1_i2.p1 TRINITY_DN74393_c0_g1~~TRINITY_DN74393_c0_g1_i2.p1  ORF type:complete len:468 (+),score=30.40 TRINITY_DN74393_c0_g1_i2:170-1573(+)